MSVLISVWASVKWCIAIIN